MDCDYKENLNALEFDHVKPRNGGRNLASMLHTKSWVLAELPKVQLVCANCHAIRTADRRTMPGGI